MMKKNKVLATIFERIFTLIAEMFLTFRGITTQFFHFRCEESENMKRKDVVGFSKKPKQKRTKKDIFRAIISLENFKDNLSRFSKPDHEFQILNLFQHCKDVQQIEILERNILFLLSETENDRPHRVTKLAETLTKNSRQIFAQSGKRLWWVQDDHCANYHIPKLFEIFRLIELDPISLIKFFNSIPQTPASLRLIKELGRAEFAPISDEEFCFSDFVRLGRRSTLSRTFVNRCFVTNKKIFQITLSVLAPTRKEDIRNFFEILCDDNIPHVFSRSDHGYNANMMDILVLHTSEEFMDNNFETILGLIKETPDFEKIVRIGQSVSTQNIQSFFATLIRNGVFTHEFLDSNDGRSLIIKPILHHHIFRDPQISTLIPFVRFFENLKQSEFFSQFYEECKKLGIFEQ